MQPDWEKAHEVALALLFLCPGHGGDRLRRRPQLPFLDTFEEEGWIDDANTSLGWIELTEAGSTRARALLEKHFGITVPDPEEADH